MQKQRFIFQGELIASLAIQSHGILGLDDPSFINIYYSSEVEEAFFNYEHSDAFYCPLKNYYAETHCGYKLQDPPIPCSECPKAIFFIETSDGRIHPVWKFPHHGLKK